jgi:predicted alpha/beta superfamily hydrolase
MNKTIIAIAIILSVFEYAEAQSTYLYEIGALDSLFSNALGEQREIWVELPESYNPENTQKYPVVYVLDGGVHMKAVSTVQSYYWGGYLPEMIVVGISNRNHRTRDLTTSIIKQRRGVAYNQETGGADKFAMFIENELIPFVENKYPASSYRTLIGHSYAGLFVVNMLLNKTDLFDNYLAIDPSLDWDNQKLLKQSKEILNKRNFKGTSLYMSLGGQLHMQKSDITIDNVMLDTSEYTLFARSNIEFSDLVRNNKQNELNFHWKFYQQDIHGTLALPTILDGLIFLFNWYPIEHTDRFNSPDTPKDELVQIIRGREKKLKDHFGYFVPPFEEDLLSMLGYMNLEWGNSEKSLAFFQLAIEYFPLSANAYDSLAEYYEAQGDYANALKNVSLAFDISGDAYHKNKMEDLKKRQ